MLRRIGNKKKFANEIIRYFPNDITVFIDLCFATGSITFEMLKKYPNIYFIANDIDNDIANLWYIMQNENDYNKLFEAVELCPYHTDIYKYFKTFEPKNKIDKALRFLYLSNFSVFGFETMLKIVSYCNNKETLLKDMKTYLKKMKFVMFSNSDLFKFKLPVSFPANRTTQRDGQFAYLDAPYIDTADNYSNSFTETDSRKAIQKLIDSGLRFAVSEFKTKITEQIAKDFNLNMIEIKERRTSTKKRDVEILMTNYKPDYQKAVELSLF